ncbi:hypothetical protein NDU88_006589 [Pleurodeles waltl]|uniref:Uncharacterized protein n=1 Tax=Pleurodeles waltl TaxID=8319 RepID=A0AAV7MGC1_PLEWA|nr:hypothetical protein NDU88_006589 [Pleurodeles waltl]
MRLTRQCVNNCRGLPACHRSSLSQRKEGALARVGEARMRSGAGTMPESTIQGKACGTAALEKPVGRKDP